MDSQQIHEHWTRWATEHGRGIRATTKTWTAKALELDALSRRLQLIGIAPDSRMLEIGCGNGVNCVELARLYPRLHVDGIDYVAEMVTAAVDNARSSGVDGRVRFFVGDALGIGGHPDLQDAYDIVFTDRCLINLNTIDLQKMAISAIGKKVRLGGHVLMIENSYLSYERQNRCRQAVGLAARRPAEFNLFFDEGTILPHMESAGLDLVDVEDFSSLHDLILYVLLPSINGGIIDYGHPLVEMATKLSRGTSLSEPGAFGCFGQNRLFVCRRRH